MVYIRNKWKVTSGCGDDILPLVVTVLHEPVLDVPSPQLVAVPAHDILDRLG